MRVATKSTRRVIGHEQSSDQSGTFILHWPQIFGAVMCHGSLGELTTSASPCLTGHLTQRGYTFYGFDAFPLRCRMRQAGLAWHFVTFTLGVARRRAGEPAPFFRKCLQLHQKLAGHLGLAYVVSTASAPRGMGSSPTGVTQATSRHLHAPETY